MERLASVTVESGVRPDRRFDFMLKDHNGKIVYVAELKGDPQQALFLDGNHRQNRSIRTFQGFLPDRRDTRG